jgi:hypothetical protein
VSAFASAGFAFPATDDPEIAFGGGLDGKGSPSAVLKRDEISGAVPRLEIAGRCVAGTGSLSTPLEARAGTTPGCVAVGVPARDSCATGLSRWKGFAGGGGSGSLPQPASMRSASVSWRDLFGIRPMTARSGDVSDPLGTSAALASAR